MTNRLDQLSRRLARDQYFLASALHDFAQSEELDEHGLATALNCPVEKLAALRLCRRPVPQDGRFLEDVRQIAERFDLEPGKLTGVVRRADSISILRKGSEEFSGRLLAAARDRLEPAQDEDGEQSD